MDDSFNSSFNTSASPRLFWQGRESASPYRTSTENRSPYEGDSGISSPKRSSIENLKRASRVKNSSMYARESRQEYDPAQVQVLDRPLATGRPLSAQLHEKLYNERGQDPRNSQNGTSPSKRGSQMFSNASPSFGRSNSRLAGNEISPLSPRKDQSSPTKSSLYHGRFSSKSLAFDPESEIWSDVDHPRRLPEGHSHHRHTKSVTFDAAPPQINEYEMTTPDPSSVASGSREGSYDSGEDDEDESFDRGSSYEIEDSFDASLEDTEKTPVVLPEDWRFMSPAAANDELVQGEEDPFQRDYDRYTPDAHPTPKPEGRFLRSPLESPDSNGERRPLPPLPQSETQFSNSLSESAERLTGALERGNSGKRSLPSPPRPPSHSKSDISGIGNNSMSLDDRLRLMMIQEREKSPSDAEKQRERRMRRAGAKEKSSDREGDSNPTSPESNQNGDVSSFELSSPPRISRESILRNIKNRDANPDDSGLTLTYDSSSPQHMALDPDVPIPSLEDEYPDEESIIVKEEEDDDDGPGPDLYSVPDHYTDGVSAHPQLDHSERSLADRDDGSSYSRADEDDERDSSNNLRETESQSTLMPPSGDEELTNGNQRISGSEFSHIIGDHSFDLDIRESDIHGRSSIHQQDAPVRTSLNMADIRESLQRPETPEAQLERNSYENQDDEPSTPESVIRHPIEDEPAHEEPANVPEPIATIKAPGTGLKARPSLTPADAQTMAATRRTVSGQEPPVPSLPTRETEDSSDAMPNEAEHPDGGHPEEHQQREHPDTLEKRQSSLVKLDLPVSSRDEGLGFGLDQEFDRVIESQKVAFELSLSQKPNPSFAHGYTQRNVPIGNPAEPKSPTGETPTNIHEAIANRSSLRQRGYLMRQNTKFIVASSRPDEKVASETGSDQRDTKSAGNSPRKASQQTWTTEPWNGKTRRQSIKMAGGMPKKKPVGGAVPPLPGQQSNAKESPDCTEETPDAENDLLEEDGERGRLFVKVVGVKELDLPLPRGEYSYWLMLNT